MMRAVQIDGYGMMQSIGLVSCEGGHWVIDRSKRSCLAVKLVLVALSASGSKSECGVDTRRFNKRDKQLSGQHSISLANWIQFGLAIK